MKLVCLDLKSSDSVSNTEQVNMSWLEVKLAALYWRFKLTSLDLKSRLLMSTAFLSHYVLTLRQAMMSCKRCSAIPWLEARFKSRDETSKSTNLDFKSSRSQACRVGKYNTFTGNLQEICRGKSTIHSCMHAVRSKELCIWFDRCPSPAWCWKHLIRSRTRCAPSQVFTLRLTWKLRRHRLRNSITTPSFVTILVPVMQ